MSYTLYLYKNHNNYQNRILKNAPRLEDNDFVSENISFNINDGLKTSCVVNTNENFNYLTAIDNNYDYLTEENTTHWFVIESKRNRNGQQTLYLRRDILLDEVNNIKVSPAFINKGFVYDGDLLNCNNEDITLNKIKIYEDYIKDLSGCPWIVAYINKSFEGDINFNISDEKYTTDTDIKNKIIKFVNMDENTYSFRYKEYDSNKSFEVVFNTNLFYNVKTIKYDGALPRFKRNYSVKDFVKVFQKEANNIKKEVFDKINSTKEFTDDINVWEQSISELEKYDVIQNKFITTINSIKEEEKNNNIIVERNNSSIFYEIYNMFEEDTYNNMFEISIYYNIKTNNIKRIDIPRNISFNYFAKTTIGKRSSLEGYKIIASPLKDLFNPLDGELENSKVLTKLFYTNLSEIIGKENVLDIQILPFAPLNDEELTIYFDKDYFDKFNFSIKDSPILFYRSNITQFSKRINYKKPEILTNFYYYDFNDKMISCLTEVKLSSPNYNSTFEYNETLTGKIDSFNIDMKLYPFNPFICVTPNYHKLYNKDYNDGRGLILSGNFSLTQQSNEWTQYKLNNKNFQSLFDRQIENQRVNRNFSIAGNLISSAASGAALGSIVPGIGTVAGAVGGLITGAVDSTVDVGLSEYNINNSKEMFNLQLDNIKSRPNTVIKMSSIVNTFKYFPILEYYSTDKDSEEMFKNKITYNGMTINRIGTFKEYARDMGKAHYYSGPVFLSGKIIIFYGDNKDSKYYNELNKELSIGFYDEYGLQENH